MGSYTTVICGMLDEYCGIAKVALIGMQYSFARISNIVKGPIYFGANLLVLPGLIGTFLVDSINLSPILNVNCFDVY